jgi:ABC-type cobalamin/Fe3+-siderophores transport system ATPase subunit
MMLELHNVTIGQQIKGLSVTIGDGQIVGIQGQGKTTLLRAIVGLIGIDEGHISIDGELLTPQSAPYFRRFMAYVPQQLSLPDGYTKVGDGRWATMTADERYLWLLTKAIGSGKQMLIADAPAQPLGMETQQEVDRLLGEAAGRGVTIVTVNDRITQNQIQL